MVRAAASFGRAGPPSCGPEAKCTFRPGSLPEEGPRGVRGVGLLHEPAQLGDLFGMAGRQVVLLAGVLVEVVELVARGVAADVEVEQLPGPLPHGLAPVELHEAEVEVVVLRLLLHSSLEQRQEAQTVARGGVASRQLGEGGRQVPEGAYEVALAAGGHVSRPRDEQRHADAPFVEVALVAAQRAVAVEEVGVGAPFQMGPVVAGEEDDGIIEQPLFAEFGHQLAHVAVQPRDHRRKGRPRVLLRAVAAPAEGGARVDAPVGGLLEAAPQAEDGAVFGDNQLGVGDGRGVEEQEGLVGRALVEEAQRLGVNQVGGVASRSVGGLPVVARQLDARRVAPQVVGVVAVGQQLAVVAVEAVDALVGRVARRADEAQPPLAEDARRVARLLEDAKELGGAVGERVLPFGGQLDVAAHGGMARVGAGKQARARRSADGRARVALCEAHARERERVDVGRGEALLPVAAQVAVAQVVGQNEEHVGAAGRLGVAGRAGGRQLRGRCAEQQRAADSEGCGHGAVGVLVAEANLAIIFRNRA